MGFIVDTISHKRYNSQAMLKYAVVEIAGKQYKVAPDQELVVHSLGDVKELVCDKVLMSMDEKGLKIGDPYLKEALTFTVLEAVRGEKIRVAKFHAKANFRKVRGSSSKLTKIKLK